MGSEERRSDEATERRREARVAVFPFVAPSLRRFVALSYYVSGYAFCLGFVVPSTGILCGLSSIGVAGATTTSPRLGSPMPSSRISLAAAVSSNAVPNREKALKILSKSIYKEMRQNGYEPKQIVALATELISLVTSDIKEDSRLD